MDGASVAVFREGGAYIQTTLVMTMKMDDSFWTPDAGRWTLCVGPLAYILLDTAPSLYTL